MANLSFAAQEALLPRDLDYYESRTLNAESCPLSWFDHHSRYQHSAQYAPNPAVRPAVCPPPDVVQLKSPGGVPQTKSISSPSVDDMDYPSDGVWYPSGCTLWWKGKNPFALPSLANSRQRQQLFYTEKLPKSSPRSLQLAMPVDDRERIDGKRGNMAAAEQRNRPDWLTTANEYQLFCSVRAYVATDAPPVLDDK